MPGGSNILSIRALVTISTSLWALDLALITVRTMHRRASGAKFNWDDIAMLATGVFISAFQGITLAQTFTGLGLHKYVVGDAKEVAFLKQVFAAEMLYFLSIGALKCSLLLYWIRVAHSFGDRLHKYRIVLKVLLVIDILFTLDGTIGSILQCIPVSLFWDPNNPELHRTRCINRDLGFKSTAMANAIFNFALLFAPIPILRAIPRQSIKWTRKLLVAGLYSIGILLVVASVLRFTSVGKAWLGPDSSHADYGPILITVIEVDLGPAIACIPTLLPFYHALGRRFSSIVQGKASSSSRNNSGISPTDKSAGPNLRDVEHG